MQDTSHVRELVQGFRENHKALKDENTSEAVIRGEYIDRFWIILGWDVHNRKHRSLAEKDVVVEANIGTIEGQHIRQRRPDYLFRIDGFPRFIVEAKKCTVDIATDKEAIFQAKTYAWSAQIPFAILTNFERFRLFDTTVKPHYLAPEGEVIADFDLKFDDYEQQWDVLEQTFGREAAAAGSLEKLLAKIKHVRLGRRIRGIDRMLIDLRGSEPVDKAFLAHLEDVRFRINAFDWTSQTRGFGRIFDERKGFDCIIGNPPYIRVQELKTWEPEECEFYKANYRAAAKGNYDIYVVFIEKGLSLLAPDGLLGFICPHKFWQATYGEAIRRQIANGKHLKSIIDFADQQVFRGATTYTAIQVLTKERNLGGVALGRFTDLHDGDAQCTALDSGRSMEGITAFVARCPSNDEPWSFVSASLQNWCEDLACDRLTLSDVASVFVGVQTSADDIYHFDFVSGDEKVVHVKSRRDDSVYQLEAEVLHPLISGTDVRAYVLDKDRQVILFPYWWDSQDERRLISEPVFNERFPLAWAYLKRHEKSLRAREKSSFDIESWYQFGRSQNIGRQRGKKICIPRLAERIRCAVDEQGNCCLDNVDVNGVRIRKKFADSLQPLLLAAVLNSTLSDSFVRAKGGTHFRGGFASFNRQFIEAIPICVPKKGIERKTASRIVERVKEVTETKSKLVDAQISDRERERLEREVEAHERRIDELVCELYGVKEIPE